ncbi:MAG: hypothetical protein R3335_15565, partial [Anaerolineales bacterium]|nr:hypothetical protein [Anaerolineales bacterium]
MKRWVPGVFLLLLIACSEPPPLNAPTSAVSPSPTDTLVPAPSLTAPERSPTLIQTSPAAAPTGEPGPTQSPSPTPIPEITLLFTGNIVPA